MPHRIPNWCVGVSASISGSLVFAREGCGFALRDAIARLGFERRWGLTGRCGVQLRLEGERRCASMRGMPVTRREFGGHSPAPSVWGWWASVSPAYVATAHQQERCIELFFCEYERRCPKNNPLSPVRNGPIIRPTAPWYGGAGWIGRAGILARRAESGRYPNRAPYAQHLAGRTSSLVNIKHGLKSCRRPTEFKHLP